jgi:hypothetical protein
VGPDEGRAFGNKHLSLLFPSLLNGAAAPNLMLKEVNIDGIFIAPFALDLAIALVIFMPLRLVFDRYAIQRWVWHRPLFDIAVFVIIVSLIGLLAG